VPARVSILPQGDCLVAVIQHDLSDPEVLQFRDELGDEISRHRSHAVVIDVSALDVIDSFFARALRSIAIAAKLKGAETFIVGIQPDVAIAMVHFRLDLSPLKTALNLDDAFALLGERGAAS
jgi:rsbT antagonist protein RsbS